VARRAIELVAAIAAIAATGLQCGSTPSRVSGGDAPTYDASPGTHAPDASVTSTPEGGTADGGASSGGDRSSSPGTSVDASGPAPVEDASDSTAADGAAEAYVAPVWATWPMPNDPASGLPRPQSYDTSVEGIAVDKVTGLTWQRDPYVISTTEYPPYDEILGSAATYCAGLTLGGFSDWRVPSRIELVSLVEFSSSPPSNAAVFPSVEGFFMSSSEHNIGTGNAAVGEAWTGTATNPGCGVDYASIPPMGQLQGPDAVRCVRGQVAVEGPHYTIANGVVQDNWTGLAWIQAPSALMEPGSVSSYCTSQTLAGGGWREPSTHEIETLFGDFPDPTGVSLDPTAFPGAAPLGQGFGTIDLELGTASMTQWVCVSQGCSTYPQDNVDPVLFPLPGTEPYMGYWVYAECVR
jgi:Protein of unknown function (DUF1566)